MSIGGRGLSHLSAPTIGLSLVVAAGCTTDAGTLTQGVTGPVVILDEHTYLEASIGGVTESFDISGNSANSGPLAIALTDDAGFETSWKLSLIADALTLSGDTLAESATGSEEQADGGICSFSRGFTATRNPR